MYTDTTDCTELSIEWTVCMNWCGEMIKQTRAISSKEWRLARGQADVSCYMKPFLQTKVQMEYRGSASQLQQRMDLQRFRASGPHFRRLLGHTPDFWAIHKKTSVTYTRRFPRNTLKTSGTTL